MNYEYIVYFIVNSDGICRENVLSKDAHFFFNVTDAFMTKTTILESISVDSFTFGLSICYFVLSVVIGVQILRLICFRYVLFPPF